MPQWDQTGVPGDVALAHFHSSTISGSASWMIARTLARVFPRQSPSCWILSSMDADADPPGLLMYTSNSRIYFSGVYGEPLRFAQDVLSRAANRLKQLGANANGLGVACNFKRKLFRL